MIDRFIQESSTDAVSVSAKPGRSNRSLEGGVARLVLLLAVIVILVVLYFLWRKSSSKD